MGKQVSQKPSDQQERIHLILDAAAELLLRHGYNKITMSDVADAVGLHRGLVYLHFSSKDALIEVLIIRELREYGATWSHHLETDPLGGTVASTYRSVLHALKQVPLMAAILTRDKEIFGKYLHKPNNLFARLPTASLTHEFLRAMQEAGAVRQDINLAAMAFILDTLSLAILDTLTSHSGEPRGDSTQALRPSYDDLMETIAEMVERMVTPAEGANLEAGKALLRQGLDDARARFTEEMEQHKKGNT
jgi:AcrR family transcriptional regulator